MCSMFELIKLRMSVIEYLNTNLTLYNLEMNSLNSYKPNKK